MSALSFFGSGAAAFVITKYMLSKRDFPFHTLIVLILMLIYTLEAIPPWLIVYESVVKMLLVFLCGGLIGRAIRVSYPERSGVITFLSLCVFFAWAVFRRFVF